MGILKGKIPTFRPYGTLETPGITICYPYFAPNGASGAALIFKRWAKAQKLAIIAYPIHVLRAECPIV